MIRTVSNVLYYVKLPKKRWLLATVIILINVSHEPYHLLNICKYSSKNIYGTELTKPVQHIYAPAVHKITII